MRGDRVHVLRSQRFREEPVVHLYVWVDGEEKEIEIDMEAAAVLANDLAALADRDVIKGPEITS